MKPPFIETKDRAIYRKAKCQSKRWFPTEEAAKAAQPKQRTYVCSECGKWHLTTAPGYSL